MAVEMTFKALVSALEGVTTITNDGVTEGVIVNGTIANVYNVTVTSRTDATIPFPITLVEADLSGVTFSNASESTSVRDNLQSMFTAEHESLTILKFMNIARSAYVSLKDTIVACPNLTYIEVNEIHRGVENFIKGCPRLETVIFNGVIDPGTAQMGSAWSLNNLVTNCPRLKYVHFKEYIRTGSTSSGSDTMLNKLITDNDSIDNDLVVVMDKGFWAQASASPNIKELFKNAGLKSIRCPSIVLSCGNPTTGTVGLDSAFEGNPGLTDFDIPVIYPVGMAVLQGASTGSHSVSLINMFKGCTSLKYIDLSCLKTCTFVGNTQTSTGMLEGVTDAAVLYSSTLIRDKSFTGHNGTNIKFIDTAINTASGSKGIPHARIDGSPIAMLSSVLPLIDPDLNLMKLRPLYKHVVTMSIPATSSSNKVLGVKTFYTDSAAKITNMIDVYKLAEGNPYTSRNLSVTCDSGGLFDRSDGLQYPASVSFVSRTNGIEIGIFTIWTSGDTPVTVSIGGAVTVSDTVTQIF